MRGVLLAMCVCATPALAEPAWPDHATCIADDMGRFERALTRNRNHDPTPDLALIERGGVLVCGSYFIGRCDLTEDRIACQETLAADQAALTAAALAELPAPDAVSGDGSIWADGLYPRLWAIAQSQSAGPDCAGADALYEAWCAAEEASRKLAEAVALWRLARLLRAVPPAVDVGWIGPAPPPMPVPRPEALE